MASFRVDLHGHVNTYQDDVEGVCSVDAIACANAAYGAARARAGLQTNLGKTKLTPGRTVRATGLLSGFEVDEQAIVLKHSDGMDVRAVPSASHSEGSRLAEGSREMNAIIQKGSSFLKRLGELRSAGFQAQSALDMIRVSLVTMRLLPELVGSPPWRLPLGQSIPC